MISVKTGMGAIAVAAAAVISTSPVVAETTLTTVTALQQTNILAKSYIKNFIGAVNAQGKGNVQMKYLGGQEVVPPRKAASALKRGQFDVLSAPTAYYIGTVPEGYGLLAANKGPRALRANGGFALLQKIYAEKAGAHLLAWGENMTSYNMFLGIKPKMDKDGLPDLRGVKMRATGTYRPLFRALGATTINIKSSEIITAMQRGTVQGFGMTDSSVMAIGLGPVIKYRVQPNFYQTNQVVTVNLASWAKLTKKEKSFLEKVALEYENTSVKFVEKERLAEEVLVKKQGIIDIQLTGKTAQKYLDIAHAEIWKELKTRSKYHDQLKPLLYTPGKPDRQMDLGDTRLKQ
ncbi:MAG: TRAP transporter substrate-binding protein DctP [Alphaproteobacteria bacterium]|jgi:TRAP-type C4-dicarboxylate transport system substrate-binding protein